MRRWLTALLMACLLLQPLQSVQGVQGVQAVQAVPMAAASGPAVLPGYRFRQPSGATPVKISLDLLDAREREFIAQLPELRVGLNLPDNRPYEVISDDGEISGIQIEILTHLALAMGLRVKPVVLPSFPDVLDALRERRIDVMATVGYEPTREPYIAYTLGTAPNPGAIIGRAADRQFADNPSLNGRQVAIERGYVAQQFVRRTWPEAQVVDQVNTSEALKSVARGDSQFYVGSMLMAMNRIQRDATAGLEVKRSLVYATGQMHFGVRKDWPLLATAMSKVIAALRAAPLPGQQAAIETLHAQGGVALPLPMALSRTDQAALVGRSVLRVGAVRGLALLNEATPGGGHAGIASDYTAQVVGRLGVAAQIVPFDSVASMLDALRQGSIHLVPFLTHTPSRAREFVYSAPYLEMPYYIVARNDAPLYWNLDSLRGKRLALAVQHPLREFLAQRYADIVVVEAPSGTGAMDMVAQGRADAAVEVKLFANIRINNDNNGVLRTVAQVDELPAQFHFAASREAAALIPLVDRTLADIHPDERARMLRRWVAIDFEPGFPWQRHWPWLLAVAAALLLLSAATVWWMRRLRLEVRSRRQAEERLRDVTSSLPGVVFQYITAADGRLEQKYLSPTVEAFLGPGMAQEPSMLEAFASRMPPDEAQALRAARAQAIDQRGPFKVTARYTDPRHGERWMHCEAAVRALGDGRLAWTGYIVDVSSERLLQARLLDAMQTKNLFVASASHELRGPLQAITLALQRLASGPMDAAQQQMCRIAQDSSAALVQLVDDVLDLARFEAGRMVLHPSAVDLRALLGQVVDNHRLAAEARGLRLALQVDDDLPPRLLVDALRLRQLLVNLIGNAVKYTVQGEVLVTARRSGAGAALAGDDRPAPAGQDRLVLVVRDTGIGIAPERQHALFEPFGTLHNPADAPDQRSTGLGLAICKRLVDAMGGRIDLDSLPGRGTLVTLVLPLQPAPAPAAAASAANARDASAVGAPPPGVRPPLSDAAQSSLVLLVDDDAVSRLLMGETLRQQGYRVTEATDTTSAYARWRQGGVALVISDHQMPDGDGLTLLQRLARESLPGQRPRLVLCSGSRLDVQANEAGIDAVLRKPVTGDQLDLTLRRLLGLPAEA